ncbi:hypothetical protein SAMN02745823_03590 [Sporobacter termitidis DSM 10068]|uniref:Uncharacterized protein n=1 Tax=Sporobacter termitidis DSM 10068 TaxID=1123282 RepID=A0A1M5ZEH2_9FIRM|nr:hypothetical protein [Sporobacter termitidis]SHI22542.1 hypothetical protein SAMN02745823_03590 [Sporobacter termitidis DSM 10068]
MADFKNDPQATGFRYSDLTDEDLKTLSDAEQKISRNNSSNRVLIAYDNVSAT